MKKLGKIIQKKCQEIKLVVTDVDGVLTDGGRYFSENGEIMKKFHARDGMGVNILLRNNIPTVILSKENSTITKKWGKNMNVSYISPGTNKKEQELSKICKRFSVNPSNIAFIGDDVNDVSLAQKIGFSACPQDGNISMKNIVDYICQEKGGCACFRELADIILFSKFPKKKNWY
ncbi:HAD hydrolase family protein [Candidatus Nitrosopelagicus sp.]|nr:HAD hydrolase family protein [Candidatus Nitrosopelagicus sp.]|tara:strand:- start:3803 stop:4327 length:525 start_codon:yes stop_codon:yes gene_type:complete